MAFRQLVRRFVTNVGKKTQQIQKIEVITQEDKLTWTQKALQRPVRTYFKIGSVTFGLCLTSNFMTSVFNDQKRSLMISHPDIFSWMVLCKSFQFGLIWPSFYIKGLFRPSEVFFLGERWIDQF